MHTLGNFSRWSIYFGNKIMLFHIFQISKEPTSIYKNEVSFTSVIMFL